MLLKARWVIPVEPADAVLERHAVLVRDGKISSIVPWDRAPADDEIVDLENHVLIPGLVNCHTHAAGVLRRGLGEDLAALDNPRAVYEGTRLACAEMVRGGITCFADTVPFPEASVDAAAAAGLRCVQALLVSEQPSAYAADAADYLRKGLEARDRLRDTPRVSFALAPHDVSDATLRHVATLAAELDVPIKAPLEPGELQRLLRLQVAGPGLAALYAGEIEHGDVALLARHGCSVVCCPSAELRRRKHLPRLDLLEAAHVNCALGTDGPAGNFRLDLLHEMRLSGLDPHAALRAATLGGATALGLEKTIGSIVPGKAADLVAVDMRGPELAPCRDPMAQLVHSADRRHVTHVWVEGQPLPTEG
jgi:5-methylthioadenosine/S-adenosylhomocysteine deaminase